MWHMLVGVLAKAAVMFTGLADTQRQLRMTATIVVLDVATLPQHLERQCPASVGATYLGLSGCAYGQGKGSFHITRFLFVLLAAASSC